MMDPRQRLLVQIGWGLFFLFFVGIALIVISDWEDIVSDTDSLKRVEIEESTVYGYDSGQKSWEVSSAYIWAGRSQYLFRLEDVFNGKLYDNQGRVVLDYLTAKSVQVNSKSQTLSADREVSALLVGRQELLTRVQPGSESTDVLLSSQRLKYFNVTKKAYLSGDVFIQQDNSRIFVRDELVYDASQNVGIAVNGVSFESEEFRVSADQMTLFLDDEYVIFDGNVRAERRVLGHVYDDERENLLKDQPVFLSANRLQYSTVNGDVQLHFEGDVTLSQEGKRIESDWVYYDREIDLFEARGNVLLQSDSLKWMIDSSRKANFLNADFEEVSQKSFTLNCRELLFYATIKNLKIRGPLTVYQDNLILSAARADYDDQSGMLNFYGRVVVDRTDRDQLKSSFLSINILEEWVKSKDNVIEFDWDD